MRVLVTIVSGVFFAAMLAGCLPAATDEEISKMCENLVKLRGEVDLTPIEARIAKIDEEMAARRADLEKRHAMSLDALAADLKAKLGELGDKATDEDRAKVEQENAARRTEAESQHAESLARIDPDREARVTEARRQGEEAKASAAAKIEECAKKAKGEGVTQQLAECRAKADTTDHYWNRCR